MSPDYAALWDAVSKAGVDASAVSWGGFNVFGDAESIAEVQRLMHCEDRMKWFEREYKREH